MRWLSSPRRRWYVLALLWAVLLVLGIGGFLQQSADGGLDRSWLDNLYLTLQLAALDYGGGGDALNWRLEVARFVAPVMAAGTILQTASVVFREQYERWRLRFAAGHVVVTGEGPAARRLTTAFAAEGRRVVRVVGAAEARSVDAQDGVSWLLGDPTDPDVLATARVDRATRLVAIDLDDAVNVAIAGAARRVPRPARGPALRCAVHLTDADLTALLRGTELGGDERVRLEYVNLHERAARALLGQRPALDHPDPATHLLVVGLGKLGRSLVVAAAQRWAEHEAGPLPVTLVDRVASGRWQALLLQHPALASAIAPTCLDLDLDAPSGATLDELTTTLRERPPTLVVVAFDDEALALASGLSVHRLVRDPSVPVVVRTTADQGLGRVLGDADRDPFPGMALFSFLDAACTPALVEGGVREQLAHALHEDHASRTTGAAALHRAWDELDDAQRESARRQADGIVDGLAALGLELVPVRRWGEPGVTLADEDVDVLAAAEHERWRAERTAAGWTHGPVRDDAAKRNPLLVPWADVPEGDRGWTVASVKALPAMLARAGFELARTPVRPG